MMNFFFSSGWMFLSHERAIDQICDGEPDRLFLMEELCIKIELELGSQRSILLTVIERMA